MLNYLTAGESHGQALIAVIDGIPAHICLSTQDFRRALARRRLGVGRGARMAFEQDEVRITAGVIQGETIGSPIAVEIGNTEWPKWEEVMSADPVDPATLAGLARHEPLTRPRPGHADLAGMQKYDFNEARPVLERASARSTAARVALGEIARQFLRQSVGIEIVSHVRSIGAVRTAKTVLPTAADLEAIDADPVRCFDEQASVAMQELIERTIKQGDTLGGVVEVVVWAAPPGLGSHVDPARRLDARLAGALMGIQAIKGVEVGEGFALAGLPGSAAHDQMHFEDDRIRRLTDHAGGIEGGMSNGEPIILRAAMKPIATVPHALATVNLATRTDDRAHHQRSDVCAVPAAAVVAEAEVALVLADACREKFGGDSCADVCAAVDAYRARLKARGMEGSW